MKVYIAIQECYCQKNPAHGFTPLRRIDEGLGVAFVYYFFPLMNVPTNFAPKMVAEKGGAGSRTMSSGMDKRANT